MTSEKTGWFWWASDDEEHFTIGPCGSREEVIDEAKASDLGHVQGENGEEQLYFLITEARQEPIDLARHAPIEHMIDGMCENVDENHGDPDSRNTPTENAWTPDQDADLHNMVQDAIRAWQAKHSIVLKSYLFTDQRNDEWVTVELDEAS